MTGFSIVLSTSSFDWKISKIFINWVITICWNRHAELIVILWSSWLSLVQAKTPEIGGAIGKVNQKISKSVQEPDEMMSHPRNKKNRTEVRQTQHFERHIIFGMTYVRVRFLTEKRSLLQTLQALGPSLSLFRVIFGNDFVVYRCSSLSPGLAFDPTPKDQFLRQVIAQNLGKLPNVTIRFHSVLWTSVRSYPSIVRLSPPEAVTMVPPVYSELRISPELPIRILCLPILPLSWPNDGVEHNNLTINGNEFLSALGKHIGADFFWNLSWL